MILGLDMSTKKTGYGLIDEECVLYESGVIAPKSNDARERMVAIYEGVENLIKEYDIKHIVFEDVPISTHKNLSTGKSLCVLQGVVLSLCFRYGISYTFYNPSAWRSIIGTYDGTREGMKREVQKQKAVDIVNSTYGLNFNYYIRDTKGQISDDDKAEAILLALAYIKMQEGVTVTYEI